jgi:hypothetical protein
MWIGMELWMSDWEAGVGKTFTRSPNGGNYETLSGVQEGFNLRTCPPIELVAELLGADDGKHPES